MISIIVPVYNAEKYLHRCIDSILAQSYTDFELLLIDDGSPDNSGAICDEYASKDTRIRVFHKKNGGVSSARNVGLDNAKGDWVTFIDSDDWIETDYLMKMAVFLDVDMVVCSVNLTNGCLLVMEDIVCTPVTFLENYIDSPMVRAPWGALLNRNLINENKIRFDSQIRYGEDLIFNMQYLLCVSTIKLLSFIGYNYYQYQEGELLAKKYCLTSEETKYSLERTLLVKKTFNKKYGTNLSYDIDYMVYLGLWPIDNMIDDDYLEEYYRLCKSIDSSLDIVSFYNHKHYSPIIRGLAEMKTCYQNNLHDRWLVLCKTLFIISSKINFVIRFPYIDFYLWYWLVQCKAYKSMSIMLKIYFSLKCVFYKK